MNTYNSKMYEFLTQDENLEVYVDMVKQFEDFKRTLITDFWKDVEKELNQSNSSEWKVWLVDDVLHTNSKLGFYHDSYTDETGDNCSCNIIFERLGTVPIYGLWFNRNEKIQSINFEQVCEEVKNQHKNWKAGSGGWWFAAYRTTDEDLSSASDLIKISPSKRSSLVEEYSRCLISALQELAPLGMKYGKNFKQ